MIAYQNVYDSLAEFIATLDPIKVLGFHALQKFKNVLRNCWKNNKMSNFLLLKKKNLTAT